MRKKPGAGSLIAVSCVLSALDAVIIAVTGTQTIGLPFCAVSALSLTGALWSSLLMCKGNRITLRTLALSRDPFAVTAEAGIADREITLLKTKSSTENFLRRTEEITPDEIVYSAMGKDYFTSEYTSLLTGIKTASPKTVILCNSILPVTKTYATANNMNADTIRLANNWIQQAAADNGCKYADSFTALADADGYLKADYDSGDGLTPNSAGLLQMLSYLRTHAVQ